MLAPITWQDKPRKYPGQPIPNLSSPLVQAFFFLFLSVFLFPYSPSSAPFISIKLPHKLCLQGMSVPYPPRHGLLPTATKVSLVSFYNSSLFQNDSSLCQVDIKAQSEDFPGSQQTAGHWMYGYLEIPSKLQLSKGISDSGLQEERVSAMLPVPDCQNPACNHYIVMV